MSVFHVFVCCYSSCKENIFLSYVNDQEAKNEEQISAEGLLPRGCWLLNYYIVFYHSEQSDESLSFSVGFLSAFGMTKRGSLRFPLR